MEIKLSENITSLRKMRKMTQEMLADTLGVTFASVSKWERGVAIPDIILIIQMADLFDVSVDYLLGYTKLDNNIDAIMKRLGEYLVEKNYSKAIEEIEPYIIKFPNNFKIIYSGGYIYYIAGVDLKNKDYMRRSIELFEESILLLSQNTESTISEISINGYIAKLYIELGEHDKGIEILKKNNVNGLFSSDIAYAIISKKNYKAEDTFEYIDDSLSNIVNTLVITTYIQCKVYNKSKKYDKTLELFNWFQDFIDSIKVNKEENSFFDKIIALGYALCADTVYLKGDLNGAKDYLKRAYYKAIKFDNNPITNLNNVKFFMGELEALDTIGNSAMEAIEREIEGNKKLVEIWNEIKREEGGLNG